MKLSTLSLSTLAVAAGLTPTALFALEAVVQSDVGAGSAVAGSIGALNARSDALQANQTAANMLVQQQAGQIHALQEQISNTQILLQQLIDRENTGSTTHQMDTSPTWQFKSTVRTASSGPQYGHPPTNVVALCQSGETLLGGGGFCTTEPDGWGYVYMTQSEPYKNGWKVSCDGNGITPNDTTHLPVTHAYAVCGTLTR